MKTVAEQAIERSKSHDEIVTIDYDQAAYEELRAECDDIIDANDVTEFWSDDPDSEDGMLWRVHVRHPRRREGDVVLETMPDQHRSSHRAANNFGSYPHNGAVRVVIDRESAETAVAIDPDGYTWIVREARDADVREYGRTQ